MPIYEYECADCGKVEEAVQKISDVPLTKCKHCSGKLHKLISQSTFHLKGGGWYADAYGSSGSQSASSGSSGTSSATD